MGTFAKFSQDKIVDALNSIINCNESLKNVDSAASTFIEAAGVESARWTNYVKTYSRTVDDYDSLGNVSGSHTEYWTNFTPDSYCSDREVAMTQGKSVCTDEYIKPYNTLANQLSSAWKTLKSEVNEKINNVELCLKAIETAATTFDGLSSSISSALGELEAAGMADNIAVEVNDDGVEVVYYQLFDDSGNVVGKFSISEMVNSFYTYTGSAMSSVLATALMYDDTNIPEGYLNNIVSGVGNNVYKQLELGFMSIASMGSIAGVYKDLTGEDYDEATITKEFESIIKDKYVTDDKTASELYSKLLNDDTNALLSAGAAFGLGSAALRGEKTYSDENVEENKKRIEQMQNSSEIAAEKERLPGEAEWPATTDEDKKNELLGGIGAGGSVDGIGIDNLLSETEGAVNLEDSTNDSLELDPDESLQTDYEADRISDIMDKLGDSDLPANIDPETRTPEEIDSEARDEYFEQNEDTLYEEREQHIEEYQSMDESEKQNALEELGYSKEDAAKLIAAPAAGQTAYVYGKFNQSLSNASNNIAAAEGVNNFVSGYDSKNTLTNVTNKTANVELTPTSDSVQTARQQLTVAKDNYDSSVTKANDAIDKASTAKDKYNKVLKNIQDKNGEDPKNWTDEQVDEYNEAATMYNDAVKEAQEAAKEVESAKQSYNQEKEQYQAVYDKWREEAEEDVGITGSEIDNNTNSSEPNTDGIVHEDNTPVQTIPDKIDDNSISIGNEGIQSDVGGQVNGATQVKPNTEPSVDIDQSGITIEETIIDNSGNNVTESVNDSSINIGEPTNDIPVMDDGKPVMTGEVKPNTDNITEI